MAWCLTEPRPTLCWSSTLFCGNHLRASSHEEHMDYLNQRWQRNKLTCKDSVEQILFEKIIIKSEAFKCRVFCSDLNISVHCLRQQCLRWVIYILAMYILGSIFDFHWPALLESGRWTWNVLTWVVMWLVAGGTQCWPGARPTKHISIEFEIRWKFRTL